MLTTVNAALTGASGYLVGDGFPWRVRVGNACACRTLGEVIQDPTLLDQFTSLLASQNAAMGLFLDHLGEHPEQALRLADQLYSVADRLDWEAGQRVEDLPRLDQAHTRQNGGPSTRACDLEDGRARAWPPG